VAAPKHTQSIVRPSHPFVDVNSFHTLWPQEFYHTLLLCSGTFRQGGSLLKKSQYHHHSKGNENQLMDIKFVAPSILVLPTSLLGQSKISYTFLIFPQIYIYTLTPDTEFRGASLTAVLQNRKVAKFPKCCMQLIGLYYRFHYNFWRNQ
jgi:hypothetical protein